MWCIVDSIKRREFKEEAEWKWRISLQFLEPASKKEMKFIICTFTIYYSLIMNYIHDKDYLLLKNHGTILNNLMYYYNLVEYCCIYYSVETYIEL